MRNGATKKKTPILQPVRRTSRELMKLIPPKVHSLRGVPNSRQKVDAPHKWSLEPQKHGRFFLWTSWIAGSARGRNCRRSWVVQQPGESERSGAKEGEHLLIHCGRITSHGRERAEESAKNWRNIFLAMRVKENRGSQSKAERLHRPRTPGKIGNTSHARPKATVKPES